MRKILRFRDLKAREIVRNRPALKDAIKKLGFPEPRWLSPQIQFWFEDEVEAWLEARPHETKQPLTGVALNKEEAKQARARAPRRSRRCLRRRPRGGLMDGSGKK